jgi:hypothetical protein
MLKTLRLNQLRCNFYLYRKISYDYCNLDENQRISIIYEEILPKYCSIGFDHLKTTLSKMNGGVNTAMLIRNDLKKLANCNKTFNEPALKFDKELKNWLENVFCYDSLALKRVTFDCSSGNILEKVAKGESVHRVRSLSELKRRLHDGKRCYALFHFCLPEDPVVFVHVALTNLLATSLK